MAPRLTLGCQTGARRPIPSSGIIKRQVKYAGRSMTRWANPMVSAATTGGVEDFWADRGTGLSQRQRADSFEALLRIVEAPLSETAGIGLTRPSPRARPSPGRRQLIPLQTRVIARHGVVAPPTEQPWEGGASFSL